MAATAGIAFSGGIQPHEQVRVGPECIYHLAYEERADGQHRVVSAYAHPGVTPSQWAPRCDWHDYEQASAIMRALFATACAIASAHGYGTPLDEVRS